ncbi:MAG: hypothetical protein RRY54_08285, partial [Angelakisella sp.]
MKSMMKSIMAISLAAAMMSLPVAAYEVEQPVTPGEKYGIPYSELYNSKGNSIDKNTYFTSQNFEISKKTIARGANLVKSFKINNRSHEIDITFSPEERSAPTKPNVIITELAVRSARSIKEGSDTVIKSGTTYKYDGELSFRVDIESDQVEMARDGVDIDLESGDNRYVRWVRGDSYGNVTVDYGAIGYGKGRVMENDKVLYGFTDTVPDELLDRNPDAYIQALNIKGSTFPNPLAVTILASRS